MKFYLYLLFLIQLKCIRSEDAKDTRNFLDIKSARLWMKGDLLPIDKDDIVKTVIDFPVMLIFHTHQQNQSEVYSMNLTHNQTPCKAGTLQNAGQIVDVSAMNRKNELYIIAVAYPDHVKVFSINTRRTISKDRTCNHMELLQKISVKAKIRSVSLVHKWFNNKSMTFMIILKKSFKQGDQISVFQWLNSGFHETYEETLGHVIKVSVLTLKPCNRPLLFVTSATDHTSALIMLLVYDIDTNGGNLVLQQKLFLSFKYLEPFMLDCNNYKFLVCKNNGNNKNDCMLYKSEADHIEFMEERVFDVAISKQRLAYAEGVGILWNPRKMQTMMAFSGDKNLVEFTASNQTNMDLIQTILTRENSTLFLLLVYRAPQALAIQMNELAYVEKLQSIARDPLEDIVQKTRDIIYLRKLLFDKIATITRDKSNEIRTLDLDNVHVENGCIFRLLINNTDISRPSYIHSHLDHAKKRVSQDQIVNVRKHIYAKKLVVHNLNYNKSLYYDLRKNDSTQLVFNSNSVISSDRIYARVVTALQHPMITSNQDSSERISHMKLFKNIKIDTITVQNINNISFIELYDEAFLRHRDNFINGSLQIHTLDSEKRTSIDNLTAKILNQRSVNNFFTLTTDQDIESDIFVSKFLVSNISAATLNSIDVAAIALTTSNNTISSPVRIENLTVMRDLVLSDENEANFTDQVRMASKPVKFSQFYYGQVKIKGRLIVNDLTRTKSAKSSRFMRILSNGRQTKILGELGEYFWMKNTAQKFHKPIHLSMPANVNTLNASKINDELLLNFLLRSFNTKLVGPLHMENVEITGNLENDVYFKDGHQDSLRIEELNANLVYRNVEANEIFGRKTFSSPLRVSNLFSKSLLTSDVKDLIHTGNMETPIKLSSLKLVKTLNILQSFSVADKMEAEEYNGKSLSDFLKMATLRTQNVIVQNLRFMQRVKAYGLNINYINQLRLPKLDEVEMSFSKKVIIKGNVKFKENLKIKKLNHLDWNEYITMLVLRDKGTQNVGGNKQYLAPVTISTAITAIELNNQRIDKMYQGALRKVGSQTITAPWKFHNIDIENLSTKSSIQNIDVNLLVYADENVKIQGNFKVRTTRLRGSVLGITATTSAAYNLLSKVRRVARSKWGAVHVHSDTNWPKLDSRKKWDYDSLHNFAVRRGSTQIIEGRTYFKLNPRFVSAIAKNDLAGIDLNKIVADSLVRNPRFENVVLTGSKYFDMPLEISDSVQMKHGLNAEIVNDFDVLDLNQTFFRKDSTEHKELHGHKRILSNVQIGNLIVKGLINLVDTSQLVFLTSTPIILPALRFAQSKLLMDSMEIVRVNQIDFAAFLEGRVHITGQKQIITGSLTFDSLRLKKGFFSKLNGCTLDRIVFKQSKSHQIINGLKRFSKPLTVIGPSSMLHVNSVELIRRYETNLHSDRNYQFEKLVIAEGGTAVFEKGLTLHGKLQSDRSNEFDHIHQSSLLLDQMKNISTFEFYDNRPTRILYLDLDNSLDRFNNSKQRSTIYDAIELLEPCSNSSSMYNIPSSFRSQGLKVRILNNCSAQSSKIRFDFSGTHHEIQVPRAVTNAQLFGDAENRYLVYMVVYFQPTSSVKSISIYRIDIHNARTTQIQEINRSNILASKVSSQLLESSGEWLLFLATDRLSVFLFNPDLEQFSEVSSRELGGDHVELLPAATEKAKYQLIVGNEGDRFVNVYMGDENSKYEEINIPHPLKSFATFYHRDSDEMLMVILMQDGSFYLLKYLSNVEGWMYDARGMITDPADISICKTKESIVLCRIDENVTLATINNYRLNGFT